MTRFKAKLRKVGNSVGVLIPLKVITDYVLGDEIELEVITSATKTEQVVENVITSPVQSSMEVITPKKRSKLSFNEKKGVYEYA